MSRILVLTLVFAPDGVSTATLVSDLALDLKNHGHQLTILTTQPHYNIDAQQRAQQPLRPKLGGLYYQSSFHGITVMHTHMRGKGSRTRGRAIDFLFFHLVSLILGTVLIGKQDIILAVSPPLTIGLVAWLLALSKRAKFIYNVQELYPDAAVKSGFLSENSILVRILTQIEKFVYRRAHALTVICSAFYNAIEQKIPNPEKISIIPNFVDTQRIQPALPDIELATELGLGSKFVVLYAGNIGRLQSLHTLIAVAKSMSDEPRVAFIIVGDGSERDEIEARIRNESLHNVLLLPYQPREQIDRYYSIADICFVPLMSGTGQTAAPSKLFVVMASGRATLLAVDEDSDLRRIVDEAQCGITAVPDDVDSLRGAIRFAAEHHDKMQFYGMNGRQYVVTNYSRVLICARYNDLIRSLEST